MTGVRTTPTPSGLERLTARISEFERLVVAFSGGADSALLAHVATSVLGATKVLCVTADSASLAPEEHADCAALAREWGLRHQFLMTSELDNLAYQHNDLDRCYHCKSALMDVLEPVAELEGATIVLGVNLDDLGEHRPGQTAAAERGARFPLVDARLDKEEIRAISKTLGLRTFDKPAAACLASRIPHGTPVTFERLTQVARAESALRTLGFTQLRVRHHGELARLEIDIDEFERALVLRAQIVAAVRDAGYRLVTLDLEGFRSGSLSALALATAGSRDNRSNAS